MTVTAEPTLPFMHLNGSVKLEYSLVGSDALGKDMWHVSEGFKFYTGNREDDAWVNVPAGYLTDGATVPRIFWSLLPPMGRYGAAAVVHDQLCEHPVLYVKGTPVAIKRKQVDRIFNEAMKVAHVPRLTRWIMYTAVRAYTKYLTATDKMTVPNGWTMKKLSIESEWRRLRGIA